MERKRRREHRLNGEDKKPKIPENKNGQDRNLHMLVRMLGNNDTAEQLKAVAKLSSNKFALAYVGALHKNRDVREAALNMLEDPYYILVVAKSSHYKGTVDSAFEKLGKMIDKIEDINIVCSVMNHTHDGRSKQKAYFRVKEHLQKNKGIINYLGNFGTIHGTMYKPDIKKQNALYFEGVSSVDTLEYAISDSVPYTFDEVKKREIIESYSEEKLNKIIEKD